jgi:hypothetical protein
VLLEVCRQFVVSPVDFLQFLQGRRLQPRIVGEAVGVPDDGEVAVFLLDIFHGRPKGSIKNFVQSLESVHGMTFRFFSLAVKNRTRAGIFIL